MAKIIAIEPVDARFKLPEGDGEDAVHKDPIYSYAGIYLVCDDGTKGYGSAFTLGSGNDLVVEAAEALAKMLIGKDVDELMANFGAEHKAMADQPLWRWLGPHKGVIALALAAVTNACYDLWSVRADKPLWQFLLDLDADQVVNLLDFSWCEDEMDAKSAKELIEKERAGRIERSAILDTGYPGYDTSVGWMGYSDEQVAKNAARAVKEGFHTLKLKVGMPSLEDDLRRIKILKEAAPDAVICVDANQKWNMPEAIVACTEMAKLGVHWIEEPTHPDDVLAHKKLRDLMQEVNGGETLIAAGEHVCHRILFKNFFQAEALDVCQVDAVRVAGVSEFLVISLMARKYGVEVIPHVGDMGQIHQHLVLFNHIGLGHPGRLLEHIPHLNDRFVHPAVVEGGFYQTPRDPGCGLRLKDY